MITVENASFTRGRRTILRDVSLSLGINELVAIVGPNGAGKTTLLHLLTGALEPSSGRVLFEGMPLHTWRKDHLATRRAVLSQSRNVSFPFTVYEILALSMPDRANRRHLQSLSETALASVGLAGFGARVLQELSGGEQQRVHLARALMQLAATSSAAPQMLFLDEPVAGLDLQHQIQTMQLVRQMTGDAFGAIAVIHDLNLALSFADRVICISEGKVACDGPPATALTSELISRVFKVSTQSLPVPGGGRVLVPDMHPAKQSTTTDHPAKVIS